MVNPDSSALNLSRAIHLKHVSCQEVMQSTLERIARLNPQSNAIVSLQEPELLMAQARERDAQLARGESMGWMHGMPQAIKDLANAQGLRTTLGSPLMKDFVAPEDGLMVQRTKAAGAIVIGKTNTPEFGLGSHTFNEVFGPTRNAWDPSKTAGGSSGGALLRFTRYPTLMPKRADSGATTAVFAVSNHASLVVKFGVNVAVCSRYAVLEKAWR